MGTKWIPCGEKFIVGDVIRWIEPIWQELKKKKKGKKKVEKLGTRRVTAEVRKVDAGGYVSLSVLECELLTNTHGLPLKPLKKGEIIRKQRSTIGKGSGERLKWSHEDARSLVVSKFLN
jgi:hypothetical protein